MKRRRAPRTQRAIKNEIARRVERTPNDHREKSPEQKEREKRRNDRVTKLWKRKNEREVLTALIEKEKQYFGS
jgi:hypothetical protein